MKNIIFNSITVEGFGSIRDETSFDLGRKGIYILRGVNGAGKTTQFSALYWALYGDSLKGVKQADLATYENLRSRNWRGTRVICYLSVDGREMAIARHIAFKGDTYGYAHGNKVLILNKTNDGYKVCPDSLYKSDIQNYINEILGLDKKLFLNTVLFGQRMNRLISASAEEKRLVFEEIFNLNFISKAKDVALFELNEKKENKIKIIKNLEAVKSEYAETVLFYNNILQTIKDFEDTKERIILGYKNEASNLENKITNLENKIKLLIEEREKIEPVSRPLTPSEFLDKDKELNKYKTELSNKISTLLENIKKYELNILNINQKIKEIEVKKEAAINERDNVKNVCLSCGQSLPSYALHTFKSKYEDIIKDCDYLISDIKKHQNISTYENSIIAANQDIVIIKSKISDIDIELEKINLELLNYSKLSKAYNTYISSINSIENKLDSCNTLLNEYRYNLVDIDVKIRQEELRKCKYNESDVSQVKERINMFSSRIDELNFELSNIEKEIDNYEWWVKTGFGSSGLKSYLFDFYLNKVNDFIKQYSQRLGLSVRFYVDTEKASKPFITEVIKNNQKTNYESLSGGEKQRVDICLSFALHDLLADCNSFINIMILDEVMEGIDEFGGTEAVYELIRYKAASNRAVFIITHSTSLDLLGATEIQVNNKNGITFYDNLKN